MSAPTAEELEARRLRIRQMAGLDQEGGLRPIGASVSTEFKERLRRAAEEAELRVAQAAEERERQRAARIAAFTGDCVVCFDEGLCPECERGRHAIVRAHELDRMFRHTAWLTRGGVPEAFRGFTLDTYPGEARVTQKLKGFLQDWDRRGWLVLTGKYGVGKTGLAVGILNQLADEWSQRPCRFVTSVDLLNEIRESYSSNVPALVVKNYSHIPLLVLDDLGSEKPSDWVAEQLFGILNHRHAALLPTIITSNYQLDDSSLMNRIGQRLFWRIFERATFFNVTGPNLRLEQEGI